LGPYDRERATWIPAPNGQVIKILDLNGGVANVDTDGDNVADNGLSVTLEERQQLASLYTAGQSLWRIPVTHFSAHDANWPFAPST
jgi:hypothetical protein